MRDAGCRGQGLLPCIGSLPRILNLRLFYAAVLVACGLATGTPAADVTLRERITPQAAVVRLGDVAQIRTADRQEARRLAAVPLLPAPAPGTQRFVRKREVADMLEASGVALKDIRFSGAEQVAVVGRGWVQTAGFEQAPAGAQTPMNRHAAILAGAGVAPAAAPMTAEQAGEIRSSACRVIGDYVRLRTTKADPSRIECKLSTRQLERLGAATSEPVCGGGSEPWIGRQEFTLTFLTAAGNEQITVRTEVPQLAAPVVVAVRPVARGNVITAADIEVRMLELTTSSANKRLTFDTVDAIIGKEARQSLQPDSIVYSDQIQSPILVKRGEVVTVAAQSGGIRVRTTAKAVQEGSLGDLIQVETIESKQRFDARVVGLREAAVYSPTPVEPPARSRRPETVRRQPAVRR